jgi:hypothetical protein
MNGIFLFSSHLYDLFVLYVDLEQYAVSFFLLYSGKETIHMDKVKRKLTFNQTSKEETKKLRSKFIRIVDINVVCFLYK